MLFIGATSIVILLFFSKESILEIHLLFFRFSSLFYVASLLAWFASWFDIIWNWILFCSIPYQVDVKRNQRYAKSMSNQVDVKRSYGASCYDLAISVAINPPYIYAGSRQVIWWRFTPQLFRFNVGFRRRNCNAPGVLWIVISCSFRIASRQLAPLSPDFLPALKIYWLDLWNRMQCRSALYIFRLNSFNMLHFIEHSNT